MESNTQENVVREQYPAPQGISGLGGWLVLVQIGLFVSFLIVVLGFDDIFVVLDSEVWEALTSPDSELYHVLWGPLFIFELVYNVLLVLFIGYILIQFYQKKAVVPRLMIVLYASNAVFGIIDQALLYQIPMTRESDDVGDMIREVVGSLITCAIWIPYFIKSERVRNTFVR